MAEEKMTGFYFKMTPEQQVLFEERMAQTGIRNKSAFIRKMCIDGYVFVFDPQMISEIGRLLRITANNVNQIAKRANSGEGVHRSDVEEANRQFAEIRICFGELLDLLSGLDTGKPGKRFIPPPKITDGA